MNQSLLLLCVAGRRPPRGAPRCPDPALSPLDQIKAGLDVYITQAEHSPSAYRMAHQLGPVDSGQDPTRQARNAIQRDRVLNSVAALIPIEAETSLAVTSWLAFTQNAILEWIDNPVISHRQLRELCMRALHAPLKLPT